MTAKRDSVDRHVELWSRELDSMDPLQEAIFARLSIVARHATAVRRDVLESDGLRYWQFKVLLMLRRQGPPYAASPSQLAEMLGLTRGALSARLAPIEDAGLIARTADGSDRRRVHVHLTAAGHQAFERHASAEGRGEDALLQPLSRKERQALADLLRKLVLGIENPAIENPAIENPALENPGIENPAG